MSEIKLAEEIIEYISIDVDVVNDTSVKNFKPENLAYEIIGKKHPELVFILFSKLRNTATEIIYRESADSSGFLIFSTLRSPHYLRPSDVSVPVKWTKEEVLEIFKNQDQDKDNKELEIDFTSLWKKSGGLKVFIETICSHFQKKEKVSFTGTCQIVGMLYAYDWFYFGSSRIFYNDNKLK